MAYGWEGEKVRLVPLDVEKHIANEILWSNDPEVTAWTLRDPPLTRPTQTDFFERMAAPAGAHPADILFAIETLEDGRHIGHAGLHQINYRHGVALTGTIIGAAEARGLGYGTDAVAVRTRYAFEVLGLRMLISEVFTENVASLKVLSRAGYREVARIPRRYWKRGAFRDVVLMVAERES